jgi:hypothetical protein
VDAWCEFRTQWRTNADGYPVALDWTAVAHLARVLGCDLRRPWIRRGIQLLAQIDLDIDAEIRARARA